MLSRTEHLHRHQRAGRQFLAR